MRLVSFETAEGQRRIGAVTPNNLAVDLNRAASLYLRDVEREPAYGRIADARVPSNMRGLFEGGDPSLNLARQALEYVHQLGSQPRGPSGEPMIHPLGAVKLRAPIEPKKFFHTAGNFREHHEEAQKAGFSHPVMPWIVFFQNVDAIIGPDEPVVHPEHLTQGGAGLRARAGGSFEEIRKALHA